MADLNKPLVEGYEFNGSEYFSEAWNMFKKEAGSFIGVTILFFIIYVVVALIPLVNIFAYFILSDVFVTLVLKFIDKI